MPLLFTVLAYVYVDHTPRHAPARRWVERGWLLLSGLVTVACWVAPFHPTARSIPGVVWKTGLVSALLAGLAWQLYRPSPHRFELLVAVLIVTRLGVNWLVLPGRVAKRAFYRDSAVAAARLSLGHPLYAYKTTVGADNATDVSTFHLTATRGTILRKTASIDPQAYYIADSANLGNRQYQTIGRLVLFDRHPALLVQFTR